MNEKNKLRFLIFKNNLKIKLLKLSMFRNRVKIQYNLFKLSLFPLRQKLIILKYRFRMFYTNLMFIVRLPAIIILGILVPILALLNLFNIREMLIKIVKGEITKEEQRSFYPKFMEVINHTTCIFYIVLLYFIIWH
jgi:hypothetical protein